MFSRARAKRKMEEEKIMREKLFTHAVYIYICCICPSVIWTGPATAGAHTHTHTHQHTSTTQSKSSIEADAATAAAIEATTTNAEK